MPPQLGYSSRQENMKKPFEVGALLAVVLIVFGLSVGPGLFYKEPSAKAAIASITDLNDLSTYKKHRIENKNVAGPANNSELNLLNISSGSGIVNYIWLADRPSGSDYPEFDHSLRVYVNGNSTASIDMDLGDFFGYAYADGFTNSAQIATQHWSARFGGSSHLDRTGGSLSLPIPFQNGIRIAVANTNNSPSSVFDQIDYTLTSENSGMSVPPYTLNVIGNKWIGGRNTATSTSDETLATIPSGNAGVIVAHSMAMGGANDYSYLERQVALYIDGESSPSVESSGTEDWFGGSDYFYTGQSPYSQNGAMGLGAANTSNTSPCPSSALVDLLAENGGFAFNSSATLKWLHNSATDTGNTYSSVLWFYRHT